jgi:hypothetical protein
MVPSCHCVFVSDCVRVSRQRTSEKCIFIKLGKEYQATGDHHTILEAFRTLQSGY